MSSVVDQAIGKGELVGYLEKFATDRVVGWVRRDLVPHNFFVVVDGIEYPIHPTFSRRGDLDSEGLDALGFEARLKVQKIVEGVVSVGCVSSDGQTLVLPLAHSNSLVPPTSNTETVPGFVDVVNLTEVSGWVNAPARDKKFFAEIDGILQPLFPRFYARMDLAERSIDGLGFQAYIDSDATDFDISCGYFDDPEGKTRVYLTFSSNRSTSAHVSEHHPSRFVVTADELGEIASALESDSIPYISFAQKFAPALAHTALTIDVLFVDGTLGSVSTRYRIYNLADGLRELGHITLYARTDTVNLKLLSKLKARVVVFVRAPLDEENAFLVRAFRSQGSRIVFDVDDLVFDESIISSIDGVRCIGEDQMEGYLWGVRHYRRFALEADLVTAPTDYLVDYARRSLGCRSARIRNTIGKRFIRQYSNEGISYVREGSGFIVGYYSGSKTHQADFQEAYPGIIRFLRTYRDAVLRVVGMFDLDEFPDLASVREQIVSVPMLPYHQMIEDLANCDVVVAPLVPGNPFCEAKSELKFFEAALRGRPCIASATSTYASATAGGQFAFIAKNAEEWFSALSELYLSPEARRRIAKAAREYVSTAYSYGVAGREAASAYFGLPALDTERRSAPRGRSKGKGALSIGVIIPSIVVGGGGHRKILRFCHDWAHQGHQVTLYVDGSDHPETIRGQIYTHFYEFECEIKTYRGSVGSHTAIVCTHWKTAFSLRNHTEPQKVIYFVQDFEALFDPANSNYVKALGTYQLGFTIACYGRWVADRLRRELDLSSTIIPFSMDKGLYKSKADVGKVVDVLFFARPSQPRRCYELGVEALKQVSRANPAIRIGLYGEDQYGDLGFPYHNFGLIKDVQKLAEIYTKAKVGICFSSTNPSLVGYEMIACGLALVDLRVPGYQVNFNGESFVYYSDPTPESIYKAIAEALTNEPERMRRAAAGTAYVSEMPDDSIIGERLMAVVEKIRADG